MLRHLRLGALGAATVTLLAAALPAQADQEDPLDQTIDRDEEIGDERVVIDHGHVDIGPRILDGEWLLLARDDTLAPPVWRSLEDMVFHLPEDSILPAPTEEEFAFIDAEAGSDLYVIPQTENYDVPWLGWNTQDPDVVEQLSRGMTLRLHRVQGPGQFTLFLQSGNFDPPQLLWTSSDPEPQDIWADTNTHVHGNWIFTEPGVYLLDVELFGELRDGEVGSSRDTLRFAVGGQTEPHDVFGAGFTEAADGDGDDAGQGEVGTPSQENDSPGDDGDAEHSGDVDASPDGEGTDEAGDEGAAAEAEGLPWLALSIGAAAVVLVALIVLSVLRARTAKAAAAKEAGDE